MDLTTLNRTPVGAAARAVGRVTFGAVNGAGGVLSGIRFRTHAAWSILLNRTRFDYRAEVGDPLNNSIVGAVVGWIATNFPEAPVHIVVEDTTEIAYRPSANGPGRMLRLLERPNEKYSGVLLWMATIVDYIRGDAYWYKVRNDSGRVMELWWLPAHMIEPRWPEDDSRVFISHYEYTVDGQRYAIDPGDIVHFRRGMNPRNTRKGVDALEPLFREILTDDEAANFTASLLRNMGMPGVVIAPANTTDTTRVTVDAPGIKQKFRETFGGDNRGEPMVLTTPAEVKVLSFNPQQMDLKALRRIPEERVSAMLHVPAGVAQLGAGLDRNTFTNYGEARVAAYTEGVIPLQRLIAAELEVQLLSEFVDLDREALAVWFDWTKVAAMQAFVADLWKRLEGPATKGLMTRAAFKKATGQPVTDADEVYVMPNNYVAMPVGGSSPPAGRLTNGNGRALASTEPLLIEAGQDGPILSRVAAEAPEVRCGGCKRLLAKATPPYEVKCPRCGEMATAAA